LNITASGGVGLCCMDIYVRDSLGNVNQQSLKEIWGSNIYVKVRKMLLNGDRSMFEICQNCDFRGYTQVPKKHRQFNRVTNRMAQMFAPEVW